jgi:hypothetical protein
MVKGFNKRKIEMKKKSRLKRAFAAVAALGVTGGTLFGMGSCTVNYVETSTVQATINNLAVKNNGSSSDYMVYTDKGVFTNNDSLLKWKFDSSDLYNELKVGCTYDFNVHGFRTHVPSMYKNIDAAKFVPTAACPTAPKVG